MYGSFELATSAHQPIPRLAASTTPPHPTRSPPAATRAMRGVVATGILRILNERELRAVGLSHWRHDP